MRRLEVDPVRCVRCGGAMRVVPFIPDADVIAAIIHHLPRKGCGARAPRTGRPRTRAPSSLNPPPLTSPRLTPAAGPSASTGRRATGCCRAPRRLLMGSGMRAPNSGGRRESGPRVASASASIAGTSAATAERSVSSPHLLPMHPWAYRSRTRRVVSAPAEVRSSQKYTPAATRTPCVLRPSQRTAYRPRD
jgi:hypothetical protein